MGKIEEQVKTLSERFTDVLKWYVVEMNKLNSKYFEDINDLNRTYNLRMEELKKTERPKRKKKSVKSDKSGDK